MAGTLNGRSRPRATVIFLGNVLLAATVFATGLKDRIELTNGGAGEVRVLVSETKDGSIRTQVLNGLGGTNLAFENFTGAPGAVIGYADGHPPALVPFNWTQESDSVPLIFEKEHCIPVTIWIVSGDFEDQRKKALEANIRTLQIWATERQGICFSTFDIKNETAKTDSEDQLIRNQDFARYFSCSLADQVKKKTDGVGFVDGMINVYYFESVNAGDCIGDSCGEWCAAHNLIAMGQYARDDLLAHELSHSFLLDHVDCLSTFPSLNCPASDHPNFDRTNVMHSSPGIAQRNFLTEGQTVRAVINQHSAINKGLYNARTGFVAKGDYGSSTDMENPICPPVQKRIWEDGGENGTIWRPN